MGNGNGVATVIQQVLIVALCLASFGVSSETINDPHEALNRKSQNFNDVADKRLMRPVASAYIRFLPGLVRRSIGGLYGNLKDTGDAINNLLQGKPSDFLSDVFRVSINTSIGLGGIFDPAGSLGFDDHDEDFAQTLATWGIPRGPYLVLPIVGPSSLRDVFTIPLSGAVDPLLYLRPIYHRSALSFMRLIDNRADLLGTEKVVFGDRYLFFRDAYLQRRRYLELDGHVNEDPFADEFDDF